MSEQPKSSSGRGWLVLAVVALAVAFTFFVPVQRLEGLSSVRTKTLWEVITN